ncbi:bacteriocin-like protein [Chryseobacterium sp. c4a]|uniref:bacteriocin-like protein n=1 Tax=Chryseobacterium sp. c4a TaxID=1573582 RepID=UPI00135AA0E5|nr:hypothetical protein [Chryseobacterium sp. c4a]
MKNLRKLSRNDQKDIVGGIKDPKEYLEGEGGGGTCAARGEACYTANKKCCAGLTCVTCNTHKHDYCWS